MSADELLGAAEAAERSGDAKSAYRLASFAHRKGAGDRALRVKAVAACRTGNAEVARALTEDLPRDLRREVRGACRQAGVRIGL
jgi:hypothetical protein